MSWSLKIARVTGIDIKVHVTFLLILFWGAAHYARFGPRGWLFGIALICLLFLCVTLHELGHSVVAQRFGVTVRQIILLPIGGLAMLGRIPQNAGQELAIALAGPAVNVVIVVAIAVGLGFNSAIGRISFHDLVVAARAGPSWNLLLVWLLNANLAMAVFNMIPAFPLDGGRVLRSLLAMRMPWQRATAVASSIGQIMAVGLFMWGLLGGGAMMMLIAVFIFFAAGAENIEGQTRTVLATHRVGETYNQNARVLRPSDRLSTAIHYILTSYQPDFAVVDGRDIVGLVTRADVIAALQKGLGDVEVSRIMQPHPPSVSADETLEAVNRSLGEKSARVAAVYDGPRYLGLVSAEDIAEAYAVLKFMTNGGASATPKDGGVVV